MSNSFYHKTDAQWNRIKFVFEKQVRVGRPPLNPRTVFNGILWILKSGGRWRDLPARYGNWNSIYHKFRQWCSLGLFDRLLKVLNAAAKEATLLEIDSTFCKVHQSACSGRKNQAIGSSRGGKNTKIHVLINERMQLLNVISAGKFTTQNLLLHYFPALNLAVKKFSRIKHTAARKFAFSSLSTEPLLAFPTKPILRLNTTLIQNCTNNATSSKGFFNALKITVTLPRASTNWLFASRISFYLLLLLFTFNLPTTPRLLRSKSD